MTKEFEKKIKEAKSEEELLKVLESADGKELTDEELELITGGGGESASSCSDTYSYVNLCSANDSF